MGLCKIVHLFFFPHLIESNHVKLHARLLHFNEINVKFDIRFCPKKKTNANIRSGRDRMVGGIFFYSYLCIHCLLPLTLGVRIPLRRGVLETTICDKVCRWLPAGRWFSPGSLVSSTRKKLSLRHSLNIVESDVKYHNSLLYISTLNNE